MTRIGIIGCGSISRFHYEGYERAGAEIVHVCDIREEAAAKVGERYGAKVSVDYRAVLDDPTVDMVSVTTIASAHKQICLDAIAAGKGVVCEKTLTDNPADSAEIAKAADAAGTFFATAYMKRFFPAVAQAREMLGGMGEIISVYARSYQPWDLWNCELDEKFTNHPSWIRCNYGGGALVCCGSHVIDLIHWLGGRPSELCGDVHTRGGMDIDNQSSAMMWLENGGICHFEACWHPLSRAGYERNGWDERFEFNMTKGRLSIYTVTWNQPENNGVLLVHEDAASGCVTEHRFPPANAFHIEMAEMVRRFECREPGRPSVWDGYVVDEVIAQIAASSREKARVRMQWQDRA